MAYPLVTSARAIRLLDVVLVVWIAGWATLGISIGLHVRDLQRLSGTVVASGDVLAETSQTLATLQDLPVVGERIVEAQAAVERAAASARRSGRASRNTIEVLSVLLGMSVVLIPVVPFAGIYLPLRISWAREVRSVRRALAESRNDPLFRQFLARRAAENLSYHQLREIEPDPWKALEKGEFEALSRAELRRLGIAN